MPEVKLDYIKLLPKGERKAGELIDPAAMERLPLGSIKPHGWLMHQLELMRDGMAGRLHEYSPFFYPERNGYLYPEVNDGWEEVLYWFRGCYPLAVQTGDERLLAECQRYIEAFVSSADEDGWFGPAYLKTVKYGENETAPDLYPGMLVLDTLIMYYEYTGDERIPALIGNYFDFCKNIPDEKFLLHCCDPCQRTRAGDMLPALYWYYSYSGDGNIIELARRFYYNINKPKTEYISTHCVDFAQRFSYDGIFSRVSGKKEHFDRTEYLYDSFKAVWGQMPRGLFAADEQIRVGCTDPRQGFEPCAIIEMAKSCYELGRTSGKTLYADRAEDIMLNHFTASFTEDYRGMHYVTSPNLPILSNGYDHHTYNGSGTYQRSFEIFTPNNRCCGHNHGMGWTWYAANLWQRTPDGGVAAWLYAESEVDAELKGGRFALKEETDYPFSGDIKLSVTAAEAKESVPLYIRVPAWSRGETVKLNGESVCTGEHTEGFIRLERVWTEGDTVEVSFDMEISFTRWPMNGSVSVDRGPLSYSVKIGEEYRVVEEAGEYNHPTPHLWENYEVLPTTPWNYGLTEEPDVTVKSTQSVSEMPWTLKDAPITLRAKAKRIENWGLQDDSCAELQLSPVYTDTPEEEIELVPLGCARLRISCLPVVTEDESAPRWQSVPEHIPDEDRPKGYPSAYKV